MLIHSRLGLALVHAAETCGCGLGLGDRGLALDNCGLDNITG